MSGLKDWQRFRDDYGLPRRISGSELSQNDVDLDDYFKVSLETFAKNYLESKDSSPENIARAIIYSVVSDVDNGRLGNRLVKHRADLNVLSSLFDLPEPLADKAFLLTWNPKLHDEIKVEKIAEKVRQNGSALMKWSAGNNQQIPVGAKAYLMRQSLEPRGITGYGVVDGAPEEGDHWDPDKREKGRKSWYVPVLWYQLSSKPFISRKKLIETSGNNSLGINLAVALALKIRPSNFLKSFKKLTLVTQKVKTVILKNRTSRSVKKTVPLLALLQPFQI